MRQEPHRLVFLDETSTTTKMTRLRGRAPTRRQIAGRCAFGHWGSQTFVAGLRCNELIAPWVIDGAMNRAIFDTYIETQLAPSLAPGDIVILDNLSPHKSKASQALLKAQGNWLLFLPPYSPDLNPIEMAFAKLKAQLAPASRPEAWKTSGAPSETSAVSSNQPNAGTTSRPQDMPTIKRTEL